MRTVEEARAPLLRAGARLLRDLLAHGLRRPSVAQASATAGGRECDGGHKDKQQLAKHGN